ncbi:MAG TPA: hypothetical protein VGB73_20560 [Pyrinomonadaceae bacterium]
MLSGRAKRVLVYTCALLLSPMPLMPYVPGTREFALALIPCAVMLTLASFYVVRGEWRVKARPLVGQKLLAASVITFGFGLSLLAGAIAFLIRF